MNISYLYIFHQVDEPRILPAVFPADNLFPHIALHNLRYLISHAEQYIIDPNPKPIPSGSNVSFGFPTSPIHNSQTEYSLVLSGYQYHAYHDQCFLLVISSNSTQITINLITACGIRIFDLRFYLLAVNPNNYLWVTDDNFFPQLLNSTSGPRI